MKFECDYTYASPEWGTATVDADDKDEAELAAMDYVHDSYPEAFDVEITEIREV